jgi:hypothetical protein
MVAGTDRRPARAGSSGNAGGVRGVRSGGDAGGGPAGSYWLTRPRSEGGRLRARPRTMSVDDRRACGRPFQDAAALLLDPEEEPDAEPDEELPVPDDEEVDDADAEDESCLVAEPPSAPAFAAAVFDASRLSVR